MIFKTKQEYINRLMEGNQVAIMYSMYCEKYNDKKHGKLLNLGEFMSYIYLWEFVDTALTRSLQYYDNKFNVIVVKDLKGRIITFV